MKLSIILLVVATLQVNARGFAQHVSLHVKDAPLQKVFREVHRQTGFEFFYNDSILQSAKKVTLRVIKMPVEQLLQICFKDQPFSFVIANRLIIIKPLDESRLVQVNDLPDETITVNGRVTDKAGNPLAGASVNVHGVSHSVLTNPNGEFLLKDIKENAILEISFIGYQTQQVKVNKRTMINIVMEVAIENLLSVIVNKGYYSTSQRLNTGSVSKVNSGVIEKQPVSNPLAALTGRVAGLDVQQQSGIPGSGFKLRIRGVNSTRPGANEPLILVDGVPYPSAALNFVSIYSSANYINLSPLNALNPADIESMEVLKDADATAIYGSRGGNGVVLITTKKGRKGKTNADFNFSTGVGMMASRMELLDRRQYLDMRYEAISNDGQTIATAPATTTYDLRLWDTTRYSDWQKILLGGKAPYTRAQAGISGGNDNSSFAFTLGYTREGSILPVDAANERFNGRLGVNHKSINRKFSAQFTFTIGQDQNRLPGWEIAEQALTLPPIAPPLYDSIGGLNWGPAQAGFNNPLARLQAMHDGKVNSLVSNGNFSYELLNGLRAKLNLGYNLLNNRSLYKQGEKFLNPRSWASQGEFLRNTVQINSSTQTIVVEPQLEYLFKLGPGRVNAFVGTTFQRTDFDGLAVTARGYASDALLNNPGAATVRTVGADKSTYLYTAVFGRLGYSIAEKYVINLTGRRDGSSRFGPGKQFGNFGAVGAAWVFSEESFVKKALPFMSYGKLRASYGSTGNDQIPDYRYLNLYAASAFSFAGSFGLVPTGLANPDYSWETNKKAEIALELALVKDRIQFTGAYYNNRSSNQLVEYPLPVFVGFTSAQANLPARIENKGWELELNTTNIRNDHFSWSSSFNVTFPRNRLISYPDLASSSFNNTYMEGHSLLLAKTYDLVGVNPVNGLYVWRSYDKNSDTSQASALTSVDLRVPVDIGKQFFGGISNTITYKGFQLDIFLNFAKQTGPVTYLTAFSTNGTINNMPLDRYERRWKQEGDITNVQRLSSNPFITGGTGYSNVPIGRNESYYGTITFLRLKNLSISYTIPPDKMKRIKSCRVYMQGQNIATLSNYKGWDPENQSTNVPLLKVFTAGIQFTL